MENFPHLDRFLYVIEAEGVNQSQFARDLGVSRSAITRIIKEKGRPSYETMIKMREAYGVDLNWFITGEGEPHKGKVPRRKMVVKKTVEEIDLEGMSRENERLEMKYKLLEKDLEMCQNKVYFLEKIMKEREEGGA